MKDKRKFSKTMISRKMMTKKFGFKNDLRTLSQLRIVFSELGWRMVNARLCETARLAFFIASPRHFDFLDCETETLKCFECERETFRLLKFEP